ncbi:MAG: AmmeMemoRadiSam system protein B [Thermodesulfobacteriota bacterium]
MARLVFLALLAVAWLGAAPPPAAAGEVPREPVLAGSWYPASPADLGAAVSRAMDSAQTGALPGRVVALAAPHAGYAYSGAVAGAAFAQVRGMAFDTVVLVGPSHRAAFPGIAVHDAGPWRTPLGETPLDREMIAALRAAEPLIRPLPEAHAREHSLEIELPFLQAALGHFRLVPLAMGDQGPDAARRLGKALAACMRGRRALLVASTDLSHFHPRSVAEQLDGTLRRQVEALDPEGVLRCLANGTCEACGGGPLAAVMLAARELGADRATVLAQADSGAVTGDTASVVGYLAAAFTAPEAAPAAGLSAPDKAALLAIARDAAKAAVTGAAYTRPQGLSPALENPGAAFVTLKRHGELRGCIGQMEARMPLADCVARMARSAALEDPRFPPVSPQELPGLDLEITVLTPMRRIADPGEVQVGRHGLYVRNWLRGGVLLPQVPVEWGWDREEFLRQTCRKAGLGPDCSRDKGTELWVFEAEVF